MINFTIFNGTKGREGHFITDRILESTAGNKGFAAMGADGMKSPASLPYSTLAMGLTVY